VTTPLLETLWLDSNAHAGELGAVFVESAITLTDGRPYQLLVDGNWNIWLATESLTGAPRPLVYPTANDERNDASHDAETTWSWAGGGGGPLPRHNPSNVGSFWINPGSGWVHPEPLGGPFSTPQPDHLYGYNLTGEGQPLRAQIYDTLLFNSGKVRLRIYGTGGWKIGAL